MNDNESTVCHALLGYCPSGLKKICILKCIYYNTRVFENNVLIISLKNM